MALTMDTRKIDTRKFAAQNTTRLLGRLAFQMNVTRKSPGADAVHDLRVAIRRFSQALGVFKSCFTGKDTRKIRRRTKKLMLLAGAVRNYDVALKLLSKSRDADAANLRSKFQTQRKDGERTLTAVLKRRMDRKSSLKWRTALEAALAANAAAGKVAVEDTARKPLPAMARDFLERGDAASQPKASPEKLHAFRIASKKFRYSLELFAPLYEREVSAWIASIKRIQTLLGDINDCETVLHMVVDQKGGGAMVGRLKKRQRRKVEEFLSAWGEEFGDRAAVRTRVEALANPQEASHPIRKPAAGSRTSLRNASRGAVA
jgi:CHAD domain-containing protein